MKYKLIETGSLVETICEKVVIDGFDYYVYDDIVESNSWYLNCNTVTFTEVELKPQSTISKILVTTDYRIMNPFLLYPDFVSIIEEQIDKDNQCDIDMFARGLLAGRNTPASYDFKDMCNFGMWLRHCDVDKNEYMTELFQKWQRSYIKTIYYTI